MRGRGWIGRQTRPAGTALALRSAGTPLVIEIRQIFGVSVSLLWAFSLGYPNLGAPPPAPPERQKLAALPQTRSNASVLS